LWLSTIPDASAQVTYHGVSVLGAEIDREVNLEWTRISFPLQIRQCEFTKEIILQNSHLVSLDLTDTSIKVLRGARRVVERGVVLRAASSHTTALKLKEEWISQAPQSADGLSVTAASLSARARRGLSSQRANSETESLSRGLYLRAKESIATQCSEGTVPTTEQMRLINF
jgi:hypothetical protein